MINKTVKNGITLISLVITTIILLILAGVTISVLTGENGIIVKVKQGKDKYSISEAKEKLEMEIVGLKIEEEGKGKKLTKEDLPRLNSDEIDVGNVEKFPVKIICNKYKFSVDENYVVTYIGEADETIVTYTTEPEGYTNKDEIKILIKVSNTKGIKTIEYPDGDKLKCNDRQEVGIDYKVTANGTWTFKIIDSTDKEITKDIVIERIDKLEPIDFIPEIDNINLNSFRIISNAQDAEETKESVKSGIGRYEYYIKKATANEYEVYSSENSIYTFENLDRGTLYDVYVKVYDRAGNTKTSDIIKQETDTITESIYIDANLGSNTTGDGSKENPYKTLEKITETGKITTGIKYNIYLADGTYNLTNDIVDLNCNKSINLYGNKKNTILEVDNLYYNNNNLGGSKDYEINFYRLIWYGTIARTNAISVRNPLNFYNVVFNFKFDTNANLSYFCCSKLKMINCTVNKLFNGDPSWPPFATNKNGFIRANIEDDSEAKLINCYGGMSSGYGTTDDMWNYQTNYITQYEPKLDSDYRITDDTSVWKDVGTGIDPDGSQADLGVYGGEYSWEK